MTEQSKQNLAQKLEDTAHLALDWARTMLKLPIDLENPSALRAQAAAMTQALSTQVRADALRLRAEREDKALEKLIETMRSKEKTVPSSGESCSPSVKLLGKGL